MSPRYAAGARVRVRDDWPERAGPCHVRTPHYVRGSEGLVVRHLGVFADPGALAFGRPADRLNLYHVEFPQRLFWEEGDPADRILVEVFEPWLEAA